MTDFVGWIFAELWYWTVYTFRLLFWLFRWIVYLISVVLNRRSAYPPRQQADLFEPPPQKKGKP